MTSIYGGGAIWRGFRLRWWRSRQATFWEKDVVDASRVVGAGDSADLLLLAGGRGDSIDLLPGFHRRRSPHNTRRAPTNKMPSRLADRWLQTEGFNQPVPSVKKVDALLHRWEVRPDDTEGFDKAEVTGGGVHTGELSSQTMEVRVPGSSSARWWMSLATSEALIFSGLGPPRMRRPGMLLG